MIKSLAKTTIKFLFLCAGINLLFAANAYANFFKDQPTIGESFGVAVKHWRTDSDELKLIKNAGFDWVRIDMNWDWVEKSRSNYEWAQYDRFFEDAKNNDIGTVVVLKGGNEIYSGMIDVDPKKYWGASRRAPSPASDEAINAFSDFSAKAAARYKNQKIIWEIWNEPDWKFWIPDPNPLIYAKLATQTCYKIRSSMPDATIIGGSLSQLPGSKLYRSSFIDDFLNAPALDCVDAIALHPYRKKDTPPESVIKDYEDVRSYIGKKIKDNQVMPRLVNSEWGYSMTFVSAQQQSDYVLRTHLADLLAGVPFSIWYEWQNSLDDKLDEKEAHFGLVTSKGTKKQAFQTVKTILPLIAKAKISDRIETGSDDVLAVSILYPDGEEALLMWATTKDDPELNAHINKADGEITITVKTTPQRIQLKSSDIISIKISPSK